MRREYVGAALDKKSVAADPYRQFDRWFRDAESAGEFDPNAMMLSTTAASGQPSGRVVLLKGVDARGFRFFTNYESQKSQEIEASDRVALTFWWSTLHRQVRIAGIASRLGTSESQEYFALRPRGSQLGAWASLQSSEIESRRVLEDQLGAVTRRFEGQPVPCPENWGGYVVRPSSVEFWQGRENRLHDRIRYALASGEHVSGTSEWLIERLSP